VKLAFDCNIHVNSEFKISDQASGIEVNSNPYWWGGLHREKVDVQIILRLIHLGFVPAFNGTGSECYQSW